MNRHGVKKAVAALVWFTGPFGTRIMLTKRRGTKTFSGWWAAVGGSVEPNEYIERAMVREMQEETAVFVPSYDMHLIGHYQEDDFTCYFFETELQEYRFKDIKNTEPKKHAPWQLFTIDEALKLPKLMPALRELLEQKKLDKKPSA